MIEVRRLEIRGVVQGVGYRWATVQAAQGLGLVGWVRNRRDGSVEAMVAGSAESVEQFLQWARVGPRGARVIAVTIFAGEGVFDGFEQWPTA